MRPYAPRPEVKQTDYGAQFVKAATESKDEGVVSLDTTGTGDIMPTEGIEPVVKPEEMVEVKTNLQPEASDKLKEAVGEEKPKKKKGGRPKKK